MLTKKDRGEKDLRRILKHIRYYIYYFIYTSYHTISIGWVTYLSLVNTEYLKPNISHKGTKLYLIELDLIQVN